MARHLAAMEAISPHRTVVIGDAVDDAVAAAHAGAKPFSTRRLAQPCQLEKAGVPVVDTLTEAMALAEQLTR